MKQFLNFVILISITFINNVIAQEGAIFPKGEISAADNHTGIVWLKELNAADSIFNYNIAVASFAPNAKLDWHKHPGGQILLVTSGTGYYQEAGKPKQIVHPGDVIKCSPDIVHWHGATPDGEFTYIATTPTQKGKTVWLQRVTEEEYHSNPVNLPIPDTTNSEQEIIRLSKEKWLWMADKNVDTLAALFNDKAVFFHMGGSWGKEQELNIIKSGGIHYKKADIHEVSVNIIGNTAILLNRITLLAVVGGNEVTNPFMVTEVYIHEHDKWTLGSLSFTKLLVPEETKH